MSDQTQKSSEDVSREHVHAMLAEMKNVMLVTCGRGDDLSKAHARPMSIAKLEADCTLQFLTGTDSNKVDEAMRTNAGLVTGQTATRFVSIRGSFEVTKDPKRIAEAWTPVADAWFPNGKSDPSVGLLIFKPTEAEVWDMSGGKGLRYALSMAKAIVNGEKAKQTTREQHETVRLGR